MGEKRRYPNNSDEISGFGGNYEKACRAMVLAGVRWIEKNPDKNPQYKGYRNIYGILIDDNDDAKELTSYVVKRTRRYGGATGAMHHACISHILYIKANGWKKYAEEMVEKEKGILSDDEKEK